MGERVIEVTHDSLETKTERVRILLCDLCGRHIEDGGRKYFGLPLPYVRENDIGELNAKELDHTIMTTNTFVSCDECNQRFR